jgi:hypothetical protein
MNGSAIITSGPFSQSNMDNGISKIINNITWKEIVEIRSDLLEL